MTCPYCHDSIMNSLSAQCVSCKQRIHQKCYTNFSHLLNSTGFSIWMCDKCKALEFYKGGNINGVLICGICKMVEGYLALSPCQEWVHPNCYSDAMQMKSVENKMRSCKNVQTEYGNVEMLIPLKVSNWPSTSEEIIHAHIHRNVLCKKLQSYQ